MKLKVNYTTGNSLGQECTSITLDLSLTKLDIIKENIMAILAHNSYVNKRGNWRLSELDRSILDNEVYSEFWTVKRGEIDPQFADIEIEPNQTISTYYLKLKDDNGNFHKILCEWFGYFESLDSIEVVLEDLFDDIPTTPYEYEEYIEKKT